VESERPFVLETALLMYPYRIVSCNTSAIGKERTLFAHIRMTVTYSSELTEAQRTALLSSPGHARFKHFIRRTADCERLWGLRDATGWVALADDTGAPGFPVWPHPNYAQACATEAWTGGLPAAIDVHEFIDEWLPNMPDGVVGVALFPTSSMKGVWTKADELRRYLAEELGKYE
jgi:hypothetical protein